MLNLGITIGKMYPGAQFVISNNDLSTMQWFESFPPPTLKQIEDWVKSQEYKECRRKAYPCIEDQLDALWKGDKDFDDMKKLIKSIKDKYPKPE